MKHYFITYGDDNYTKSKKRILAEAKATGKFDELYAFGPENLMKETLTNPLMQYKRGGGYWIWKADIVLQTLKKMEYGDILVYVDSGCSLFKSDEWDKYFSSLHSKKMLVFRINSIVKSYTKKSLLEKFESNGKYFANYYQLAAGVFFVKKTNETIKFFKEWRDQLTLENVLDVSEEELKYQKKEFVEHRHDQSVFTCLVYRHTPEGWIDVRWNNFDKKIKGQAIWVSRYSDNEDRSKGELKGVKLIAKRYCILPSRSIRQYLLGVLNTMSL